MDADARLNALTATLTPLPDEATLPVGWIRSHLGNESIATVSPILPMTVGEVAEALGRAPSTVRGLCASGELPAYKLRGKEWRVEATDLRWFLDAERERHCATQDDKAPSAFTERKSRRLV
jgi:excisionase family DNA binding protein